ncbi:scavenger receptor class F member 1 [Brachionichthys hirsutus]|uniref:scavenger receptor class F member 1 n=1 Tax=Brachionichthys hirsutus TaxID=412623 RepID=UPI0036054607
MNLVLGALNVLVCCSVSSQTLDPAGRNVCQGARDPSRQVCCPGWGQDGKECTIPVCEGEQACLSNEICVYPGVCHCPAGYYGAHCKTRCPPEFWAPNCRQACQCHPHGRCHPVTGECTCNANRWGPLCQHTCKCARHGRCHPTYGNCTCDEGWWSHTCSKPCQCTGGGSVGPGCEQLTGRCQCHKGHWGLKCPVSCNCYLSPCNQRTGVCDCQAGWWGPSCDRRCNCELTNSRCDPASGRCTCHPGYQGPFCNRACEAGTYGSGCEMSCGFCKDDHLCSATDGACAACRPGWNGTRCNRPCPPGYYGDGCSKTCPHCRKDEPCDPQTGRCWRCDPGWIGSRCDEACSNRTYGDACNFLCSLCIHGYCHRVTGRCVCRAGFQGESCNRSCPALHYGPNCSSTCDCGEGVSCHTVTGICPNGVSGAVLAGILGPLLLLLLAVLCCCLCCGGGPVDIKDRAPAADGGWSVRVKYHVYGVLANIGAALPCISDWSSGLPRVTVSHHDPELTFNHSFIEPPSSGWVAEGSSFDSDEEEGEALYCVPPREDIEALAGGEFQEMSSKCNMFLDPSGFSSEDIASPFNIPRTSSLAKSKRPSVSFAQGTRFSPKERRGSAQDPPSLAGHVRNKPKSSWGFLMLSSLQSQGGPARTGEESSAAGAEKRDEEDDVQESSCEVRDQDVDGTPARAESGQRWTESNTAGHKGTQPTTSGSDGQSGVPDKVTTVYVTVGKAGRPATTTEASSEGPVQAMLRRLGSLQRQREQEPGRVNPKAPGGVTKPPRKKLGARASMWEQGEPSAVEVGICKPIRRKRAPLNAAGAGDGASSGSSTPNRPLSAVLRSLPEVAAAAPGSDVSAEGDRKQGGDGGEGRTENGYLTVGPAGDAAGPNEGAEPCYENITTVDKPKSRQV